MFQGCRRAQFAKGRHACLLVAMVTGNEYIFEDIDQALAYVLDAERKALAADVYRKKAPDVIRPWPGMFNAPAPDRIPIIPVDSLDYPLTAWFNNETTDRFVMTRLKTGRYSLKPNLRNRKYLFRGESEFHNPCKPNLFRKQKQRRFTAELVRGQEMRLLMMTHPLVELLDTGVELCGVVYRFEMNLFGLTQHYYNKTSFLDLTSDPQVAAFFATAKYDWDTDSYSPIVDEMHKPGVLYYYSLDINEDFVEPIRTRKSPLSTIGLQVFPRSGMQKGFLYDLRNNENFNDVPRTYAVRFKHKADIAQRLCDSFDNGEKLFPDDLLMQHWRRCYKDSNVISNRTVLMNKHDNPRMTLQEVEEEICSLGFEIQDYQPAFTSEELNNYYEAVQHKGLWTEFCEQIHIPGDKQGRMMNELINLPNNPKYRWAFERDDSHVTDLNQGFVLREYRECLQMN